MLFAPVLEKCPETSEVKFVTFTAVIDGEKDWVRLFRTDFGLSSLPAPMLIDVYDCKILVPLTRNLWTLTLIL